MRPVWIMLVLALTSIPVKAAWAADAAPPWSIALRETVDGWAVFSGLAPGTTILNKLQISGTLAGDRFGLPGWSLHGQIFRFDVQALSAHMGDIQTADNLEAPPVTRLFEAWIARQWGSKSRSINIRLGLIDLNSQFDSIDPAILFINSSHGIGPDLSRSGPNGPSIYPVTAPGFILTAVPSAKWTLRIGNFDGVAGDLDRPRAFVAEQLGHHDGMLTIGQADYQLDKHSRIESGGWRYRARTAGVIGGRPHDTGAYVSIETPLPIAPRVTGWSRVGFADGRAQAVAGYIGMGAVQEGSFAGRPDDRLGVAIAHAIISDQAVTALAIHHAETSLELTYQAKLSERVAIQPDVEYIRHPTGIANAPDSLGFGLRLVLSAGFPTVPKATDSTDPTVPADGSSSTPPANAPGPSAG